MKMRKIAVAVCVILLITMLCFTFTSCSKYDNTLKEGNVEKINTMKVDENGDFKILQFTDTHLISHGTNNRDDQTLRWIEEAIDTVKPDLVEMTGDITGNGVKDRNNGIIAIANLMERKQQYWSYTCGNHDGEHDVDAKGKGQWVGKEGKSTLVKDVCSNCKFDDSIGRLFYGDNTKGNQAIYDLLTGYEYCVSAQDPMEKMAEHRDAMGVGNYVIDLVDNEGKVVYGLLHMDTHGKMYLDPAGNEEGIKGWKDVGYVGLTDKQINWYSDKVQKFADLNVKSSIFMHIPNFAFRQMVEEADETKNADDRYFKVPQYKEKTGLRDEATLRSLIYDKHWDLGFLKKEGVYGPRWDDGLIAAMDKARSTNMIAVGHDHNNSFFIHTKFPTAKDSEKLEDDFMLCYGRCSGVNAWERKVDIGATVYTIHTGAANARDMYDIEVIYPSFKYVQYYKPALIDSRHK